jgi:hypothetical protein
LGRGDKIEGESDHGLCLHRSCQRIFEQKTHSIERVFVTNYRLWRYRKFRDEQTGGEWTILGKAVAGELKVRQLSHVVSLNHFWFSWAAFRPETKVYQPRLFVSCS